MSSRRLAEILTEISDFKDQVICAKRKRDAERKADSVQVRPRPVSPFQTAPAAGPAQQPHPPLLLLQPQDIQQLMKSVSDAVLQVNSAEEKLAPDSESRRAVILSAIKCYSKETKAVPRNSRMSCVCITTPDPMIVFQSSGISQCADCGKYLLDDHKPRQCPYIKPDDPTFKPPYLPIELWATSPPAAEPEAKVSRHECPVCTERIGAGDDIVFEDRRKRHRKCESFSPICYQCREPIKRRAEMDSDGTGKPRHHRCEALVARCDGAIPVESECYECGGAIVLTSAENPDAAFRFANKQKVLVHKKCEPLRDDGDGDVICYVCLEEERAVVDEDTGDWVVSGMFKRMDGKLCHRRCSTDTHLDAILRGPARDELR